MKVFFFLFEWMFLWLYYPIVEMKKYERGKLNFSQHVVNKHALNFEMTRLEVSLLWQAATVNLTIVFFFGLFYSTSS